MLLSQAETAEQTGLTEHDIERIKADARRDGFVVTAGGVLAGVSSVAAPVFAAADSLPLVVALVFPTRLATPETVAYLAGEVRADRRGGLGRARAGPSGAAADRAPGVAGGADAVSPAVAARALSLGRRYFSAAASR